MPQVLIVTARMQNFGHLSRGLVVAGYDVRIVNSNVMVWRAVMESKVDYIVLDAGAASAELDAWRLCSELSGAAPIPLILLVRAGRNQDRVRAFRAGAQRILTQPVSLAELRACFGAIPLPHPAPERDDGTSSNRYADACVQIDLTNRQIRRGEETFPVTPREHALLQELIQHCGNAVSNEALCRATWRERRLLRRANLLKIYISRLRLKIEPDPKHPRYLVSRRGLGYAFMPQEDAR